MTTAPGTYALLLLSRRGGLVRVGRLGTLELPPGACVYVGSAFGPGGLAARIRHHHRPVSRPHWHIDYLHEGWEVAEIWFTTDRVRHEHAWARALARFPGARVPMPGFGSSDCQCPAHLVAFGRRPSLRAFRRTVSSPVRVARPVSKVPQAL